ncbi:MAG: SiaB family protein kinase [Bacteroidota bacterium]|nr:SiaB family protein kinase [Bacteroidota bacterium]
MSPELSYWFFNKLENDHFSLIYMGEFDDEITETLMRANIASINEPAILKKKLSFLMVECFQNIIRHADKPEIINATNNKPKMFLVRNIENAFYISTTNLVENSKSTNLTSKLKSINKFTPEELKADYLDVLEHTGFSEKGGGGLGLIEMARKSDSKLEFDFEYINYFYANFFMQIRLGAFNERKNDNIDRVTLKSSKDLYNAMVQENILMIRKGDFSQQSILPLIDLIKNNIDSNNKLPLFKKKTLYILIEVLQNISKHAKEENGKREGLFMISLKNNRYTINTGNFIDIADVESLKEKLETLVSLDEKGLAEIYKKKLLNEENDKSGNVGIGLIEMGKYSSEKLKYNFMRHSDTLSFFSLSITV